MNIGHANSMNIESKPLKAVLTILLALAVVMKLFASLTAVVTYDELWHLRTAWLLSLDYKPYWDFLSFYHVVYHAMASLVIRLAGNDITAVILLRLCAFLAFIGLLRTAFIIAKETFGAQIAYTSTIFLASARMGEYDIRPDIIFALCSTASALYLFRFIKSNQNRHILIAGCLAGLAFIVSQKALSVIFLTLLALAFLIWRRKAIPAMLAYYLAGIFVCIFPCILYLIATGQVQTYLVFCWVVSRQLQEYYGVKITVLATLKQLPIIWLFFLLFLSSCKIKLERGWIAYFSIGMFIIVVIFGRAMQTYWLSSVLPFVAIGSAVAVHDRIKTRFWTTAIAVATVLVGAGWVGWWSVCQLAGIKASQTPGINLLGKSKLIDVNFWQDSFNNQKERWSLRDRLVPPQKMVYDSKLFWNAFRPSPDAVNFSRLRNEIIIKKGRKVRSDHPKDIIKKYRPFAVALDEDVTAEFLLQAGYQPLTEYPNLWLLKNQGNVPVVNEELDGE